MNVIFSFGKVSKKEKYSNIPDTQNIYLRVYHSNLDDRRSTEIEVSKEGWDFDNDSITKLTKGSRTFEESQYLQMVKEKLDKIRATFENEFRLLKLSTPLKSFTQEEWRGWVEQTLHKALDREVREKDETPTLIWAYEEFIRIKTRDLAENTIKGYNTHLNIIREFSDFEYFRERNPLTPTELKKWEKWFTQEYGTKKARAYKFNETDLDFYRRLRDYNERKGNGDSYFYKIIDNLRSILRYWEKVDNDLYKPHKHINNPDFKSLKLKTEFPTLSEEEMELIFNYKGKAYLENTSKVASLMYHACLRWSELKRELSKAEKGTLDIQSRIVQGKELKYWTLYQNKNDGDKCFPISPLAESILLGSNPPHVISSQKINDYLKELFIEVGILDKDTKTNHGAYGSHIFRRSFITNMNLRGYNDRHIMEYSGHKSEKAYRGYCDRNKIQLKVLNPIIL